MVTGRGGDGEVSEPQVRTLRARFEEKGEDVNSTKGRCRPREQDPDLGLDPGEG